jgi:hypothetical protein
MAVKAKQISIILAVVTLGLAVSSCDKCGDWFWNSRAEAPQSCKGGPAPR